MPNHSGYELEIIRVRGHNFHWAIKATIKYGGHTKNEPPRYRGYYYKTDAIKNMETWQDCDDNYFPREFYHNFFSADTLRLVE